MGYVGKKPTAAPLTASDVTDGIISNAKLAQDVISAETALTSAPADTDEFLLSDAGTLKRIDYSLIKSDPTHVLLSTTTVSSAVAEVDITSNIDSTYSHYKIMMTNVLSSTDGANLQLRFFQGGTVDTGSIYDHAYDRLRNSSTTASISTGTDASFIGISDSLDSQSSGGLNGTVELFNPADTSHNTMVKFSHVHQRNSDTLASFRGGGRIDEATAVDGVRFFMSSGNISGGTFKLYGVN